MYVQQKSIFNFAILKILFFQIDSILRLCDFIFFRIDFYFAILRLCDFILLKKTKNKFKFENLFVTYMI